MGFFGRKTKGKPLDPEHKFEYINLANFESRSAIDKIAYGWIYFGILISVFSYVADLYTAVVLLVFNRWSSQINPIIPFSIARIIFAVCILFSFLLLLIEWIIAIKIIRRGGVADAYMDVVALHWNCVWGGKAKGDTGWRRFLVFAELTKSRGKKDYVALFTYFSLKGWIRVTFAEGPRVATNAFTLISVAKANLIPKTETETFTVFVKFFENIKHLADHNKIQVIILGTMAFTTIVWIFAVIRLIIAGMLYLCYLWHVVEDGLSLREYCKDRIDTRMSEIVQRIHHEGLRKENRKNANIRRQPTVPDLVLEKPSFAPSAPPKPTPIRVNSLNHRAPGIMPIAQRPIDLNREPTLPNISELEKGRPSPLPRSDPVAEMRSQSRPALNRTPTTASHDSYSSVDALISMQAEMGHGGQGQYPGRTSEEATRSPVGYMFQHDMGNPYHEPINRGPTRTPGPPLYQRGMTPAPEHQDVYTPPRSQTRTPAPQYPPHVLTNNQGSEYPLQVFHHETPNPEDRPATSNSGRTTFVIDRLAREQQAYLQQGYNAPPPGQTPAQAQNIPRSQTRFPIKTREPPTNPQDSHYHSHNQNQRRPREYQPRGSPPPRPQMYPTQQASVHQVQSNNSPYGPYRSQIITSPPERSQTAAPGGGRATPNQGDGYEYFPPMPPRSITAPPSQGGREIYGGGGGYGYVQQQGQRRQPPMRPPPWRANGYGGGA